MNAKKSQKKNIEAIYPLSPMQEGMLFHSLLEPQSGTYTEQLYFDINGNLDIELFKKAVGDLIKRHTILRTSFIYKKSAKQLQAVFKDVPLPLHISDWQEKDASGMDRAFQELLEEDRTRGYDLSKAPLLRIYLIRIGAEKWRLLWSNHHIILDGWSTPILLQELFILYESAFRGHPVTLPPARPFKEYIMWLNRQNPEKAMTHWRSLLADIQAPTPFNIDKLPFRDQNTPAYAKAEIQLDNVLTQRLKELARQNGITPNTLMQGAWSLLLHHYSRENKVVFGVTVSGRPAEIPEVERMVGLFINTLPLCVETRPSAETDDWLRDIQKQAVAMRDFEYSPLADVQRQSGIKGHAPLFESILVFENYPVEEEMAKQKRTVSFSGFGGYEQTNFPLTLLVGIRDNWVIEASYQTQRFSADLINRMLAHLKNLLISFAQNITAPLAAHSCLSGEEYNTLLARSVGPAKSYDPNAYIIPAFENTAQRLPDHPALIFENQSIPYATFHTAVNNLAKNLTDAGVRPEDRVAVFMERSPEMVTALYAVMKCGAVYVPVDPTNPAERIRYMLNDCQSKLLLTQDKWQDHPVLNDHKSLLVDFDSLSATAGTGAPSVPLFGQQAAYMIYTSGSTGAPKGTLVSHQAIRNRLKWMQETFSLTTEDKVLQKTPYTFDVSVWEFFWPLTNGATLVIARPEGHKDPEYLIHVIRETGVTTLHFVPPMLQVFLESPHVGQCTSLKRVICSGEALPYALKERFYKLLPESRLHNLYGPTEAAVDVTHYACPEESPYALLPIGKAIANTSIYILDHRLHPVPDGVPGELFIGGIQVGRGYFNRPGLTAEKFIPDPFSFQSGARMYRTGDLVRKLPDGEIDYIGRMDFQLKIRGFRIELGEIEHQLTRFESIREAVVLAVEPHPGNKQLAAYFIPTSAESVPGPDALKSFLSKHLPDYMIPTYFIPMDAFPLTPNGKIDRRALPRPKAPESNESHVAPANATEATLAVIWSALLNRENVSCDAAFFDLGGHSILAIKMIARIRDAFEVELPINELFNAPTIRELALKIEELRRRGDAQVIPPINKGDYDDEVPVSLPQQRLWFIDQFSEGNAIYNIPYVLRIRGALDTERLEHSIRNVIARHESLRTRFINKDGVPYQKISPDIPFDLKINDVSADTEAQIKQRIASIVNHAFNLETGPLFKIELLREDATSHILAAVMHHIISDGWSMNIMVREVLHFYQTQDYATAQSLPLPSLEIQYADFALWQRAWLQGDVLDKQIQYWKETLGYNPPVLELPADKPRPAVQTFNGAEYIFELPRNLASQVHALGKKEGLTHFVILLAAFQTLLHRYSGQQRILVGSPVAGRHHQATQNLIGFFVNTLVLKADFEPALTFRALTRQVRETLLDAFAHQDIPFEQLVESLQVERDLAHPPLFQVAFIPQDTPDDIPEIAGLSFEAYKSENVVAKVDLSAYVTETSDSFLFRMEYNRDLFHEATIRRMCQHYMYLMEQFLTDPKTSVSHASLLTSEEENQLRLWNALSADFDATLCVHQQFERVATTQPGAVALRHMGQEMTYGTLNARANQLACLLREHDVTADDIIGICMDRSFEMITAMLAILKAGAAYLPLDPAYPAERLRYMLADSGARLVITDRLTHSMISALVEDLSDTTTVLPIHRAAARLETLSTENSPTTVTPLNLAYVIYTSGSTGKPKGTLLPHIGLLNLANEQRKAFDITNQSRIFQFASLGFDAATWETVMALLNGAALHLTQREVTASGDQLADALRNERVTTITLPPSVLAVLPETELPELQTIITAGEKCPAELVKKWQPGRRFVNAYGPTETTVCASIYSARADEDRDPPIGSNLANFRLYILDASGMPVPVGVPGELCIGGIGLARGYLNRPDLTAEKFIPDAFSGKAGERLYRTGDRVKRLPDGNIEFLGRIDFQVKLRGFRIELGEIEAALLTTARAQDALVMLREDNPGDPRLVAYLVADTPMEIARLRETLAKTLPDYMIPSAFVYLDAMPLTPNGKIDRRALPVPEQDRSNLRQEYVAPRNETEEQLAGVVRELLHIEKVGIHDSFFELGGHSLLATQFVSRLRDLFKVDIPLRVLFEKPTVAGIAEALAGPDVRRIDADEPALEAVETDNALLEALDDLSDEEWDALLDEDDELSDD
ncbi:MAG: amino acid adenylation domain-containing protein [Calditrichaeota bacterium]|nr:MAG: amino acid adenylation domain-containing protein [Calditrichota bacterium]